MKTTRPLVINKRIKGIIKMAERIYTAGLKSSQSALNVYEATIIYNCDSWIGLAEAHEKRLQDYQDVTPKILHRNTRFKTGNNSWCWHKYDALLISINAHNTLKHYSLVFLFTNDVCTWKYSTLNWRKYEISENAVHRRMVQPLFSPIGISIYAPQYCEHPLPPADSDSLYLLSCGTRWQACSQEHIALTII